jgi:hypothetical protein
MQRFEMSKPNCPVQCSLQRTVAFGNFSAIVQKEFHGIGLTFPTGVMKRLSVLLIFGIQVTTLKSRNII